MDEPAEDFEANKICNRRPPTRCHVCDGGRVAQEAADQVEGRQRWRQGAQDVEIGFWTNIRFGREERDDERVAERRVDGEYGGKVG